MVKGKIHRNLMTSRITNYASTHLADEMREAGKYPATNYSNDKVMVQAPSETWKRRWGKRERVENDERKRKYNILRDVLCTSTDIHKGEKPRPPLKFLE